LAGFVTLDALILNTDRHHENWGLIRTVSPEGKVKHRVAPSFDHASSLGRNEPAEKVAQWLQDPGRLEWYAQRGRGAIFLKRSDAHGANPLHLFQVAARRWPAYFQPWGEMLHNVGLVSILLTVDRVPATVISPFHREFARGLLQVTFSRMIEVCS
jgi:hypothetical protein